MASEEGYLYVYNMDENEGGDLTLYKQHRLDGAPEETAEAPNRSEPQPINEGGNIYKQKCVNTIFINLLLFSITIITMCMSFVFF